MNEERILLSFGAHIKSLRLKKDISQENIARYIGIFMIWGNAAVLIVFTSSCGTTALRRRSAIASPVSDQVKCMSLLPIHWLVSSTLLNRITRG
jgi:transcriptional regulator with XRE-family HTH domain